jgi:hypothetical protein
VDEDDSRAFANDHEKLLQRMKILRNYMRRMQNTMSIMINYVLRVKGKMNGCKRRMLVTNKGRCMLETGNMNT